MKKFKSNYKHSLIAKIVLLLFIPFSDFGLNYTSYFTGKITNNKVTSGGICLMCGSTENDEAMKWYLNGANGGDVLVLRATGGEWKSWYVLDGKLTEMANNQIQCWPLATDNITKLSDNLNIFPNPTDNKLNISSNKNILKIEIYNLQGTLQKKLFVNKKTIEISTEDLRTNIYIIHIKTQSNEYIKMLIKK